MSKVSVGISAKWQLSVVQPDPVEVVQQPDAPDSPAVAEPSRMGYPSHFGDIY